MIVICPACGKLGVLSLVVTDNQELGKEYHCLICGFHYYEEVTEFTEEMYNAIAQRLIKKQGIK